LNEDGIPTPLVHTLLRAPESRMDVLSKSEIERIVEKSRLRRKYNEEIDRESAYEILSAKIEEAATAEHQKKVKKSRGRPRKQKSALETVVDSTLTRQVGRTVARELTRGLLGVLGIKTTNRRRKSRKKNNGWFW